MSTTKLSAVVLGLSILAMAVPALAAAVAEDDEPAPACEVHARVDVFDMFELSPEQLVHAMTTSGAD